MRTDLATRPNALASSFLCAGIGSGGAGEKMAVPDTLGAFASSVGGKLVPVSAAGTKACGIIIDSRKVKAGEIFCAVHGEHADGHAFVESAAARSRVDRLTQREREIANHIVNGRSCKEIGQLLGISHRTVEAHRAAVMRKVNARNTADLVSKVTLG